MMVPRRAVRTRDQLDAAERFAVAVAGLGSVRVTADAEGWPIVPGRLGAIEWACDGLDCHGCRLPGFVLAVSTTRRRLHRPLLGNPGVVRHQRGTDELRAVFAPDPATLQLVARVIRPRRRRVLSSAAARALGAQTAYRGASRAAEAPGACRAGGATAQARQLVAVGGGGVPR